MLEQLGEILAMLEPRTARELSPNCPEHAARRLTSRLSIVEVVNNCLARFHAAVPAPQRRQRVSIRKVSPRRVVLFARGPALLHAVSLALRICYCDKKNYRNSTVAGYV